MKYFQAILPDHPVVVELVDRLGWEGYAYLLSLMALYAEIGEFELTEKILSRRFGMNSRKVSRIFPILSESFAKVCQSLSKVSESFTKVSESLPKLEGQNPDGSTRACAPPVVVVDIDKNNYNNTTTTETVELDKFASDCEEYARACGNPNWMNFGWVKGFVKSRVQEAKAANYTYTLEDFMGVWQLCCDSASSGGITSAKWFLKAWNGNLATYQKPSEAPAKPGLSHGRKLMAAKQVINRFTREIVKTEDLTIDHYDQIWTKVGHRFPDDEFEPVKAPAHA